MQSSSSPSDGSAAFGLAHGRCMAAPRRQKAATGRHRPLLFPRASRDSRGHHLDYQWGSGSATLAAQFAVVGKRAPLPLHQQAGIGVPHCTS
jgi:hypothetical protein